MTSRDFHPPLPPASRQSPNTVEIHTVPNRSYAHNEVGDIQTNLSYEPGSYTYPIVTHTTTSTTGTSTATSHAYDYVQ